MRSFPNNRPSLAVAAILFTIVQQFCCCHGCFESVKPLKASKVWVQARGVQSYLQYEAGSGDTIYVTARGRGISEERTFKCLRSYSPDKVFVELQEAATPTANTTKSYMCLRFEVLSKRVLRIYKSGVKNSKAEVDCESDVFTPDPAVLVDANDGPAQPCPLYGSFQAKLHNPPDMRRSRSSHHSTSASSSESCSAKIHFNCNNQNVVVTFDAGCKPPIYKHHLNKVRYHSSTHLSCVGDWPVGSSETSEGEYKVMVLRNNDDHHYNNERSSLNIWCLHYKMPTASRENFVVYLSFNGKCATQNPFMDNSHKSTFFKDTMFGHIAYFVPPRDARCSNKFYLNRCRERYVNCSESNACPSQCGRCYAVPKSDKCKFMPETIGTWDIKDSMTSFSVKVDEDGFETSGHGKYSCRYSDERKRFYNNPVMQYDSLNNRCMPIYACMQIFSFAPGVSTFYLRQAVVSAGSNDVSGTGDIATCEKTNELFRKHRVPEGDMITLLNEDEMKPMACEFGDRYQFPTSHDGCSLNVEECSGESCTALNVSYDNATCHENAPVLPVAQVHRCYAHLKFRGAIGLITYSDELEKYSCWIIMSTRLFVTEPQMCNSEAATRVIYDKHSAIKFDPIKALTVPEIDPDLPGSSHRTIPHLFLNFLCLVLSSFIVVIMKSLL